MVKSNKQFGKKNSKESGKKEKDFVRVSKRLIEKQSSAKNDEKKLLQKRPIKTEISLKSCKNISTNKKHKPEFIVGSQNTISAKIKLTNIKKERVVNLSSPVKTKNNSLDIFEFEEIEIRKHKKSKNKLLSKNKLQKSSKILKNSVESKKTKMYNEVKNHSKHNWGKSFQSKFQKQELFKNKNFVPQKKKITKRNKLILKPNTVNVSTLISVTTPEKKATNLMCSATDKNTNTNSLCFENNKLITELKDRSKISVDSVFCVNKSNLDDEVNCDEHMLLKREETTNKNSVSFEDNQLIADLEDCSKISVESVSCVNQSNFGDEVSMVKNLLLEENEDVNLKSNASKITFFKAVCEMEEITKTSSLNVSTTNSSTKVSLSNSTLDNSNTPSFSSPTNFSTPAIRKKLRKTIAAAGVQNLFGFDVLLKKKQQSFKSPIMNNSSLMMTVSNKKSNKIDTDLGLQINIDEEEVDMKNSLVFTDSYNWSCKESENSLKKESDNENSSDDEDYVPFSKNKIKKNVVKPKLVTKLDQVIPDFSEYMNNKLFVE